MSSTELATIGFEDAKRATVATIRGEVDLSNADRLLDELMARVGAAPWLVVDLGGCSYLDSAGLRVIARVDVRCRDVGAGLRLVVDPGSSIDIREARPASEPWFRPLPARHRCRR